MNVGEWPYAVSVTPDGKKVYVTNSLSNTISVIDMANDTVTATVNLGNGSTGVAFGHFTDSNASGQNTKTNSAKTIPSGFNVLILIIIIVLYIWKK